MTSLMAAFAQISLISFIMEQKHKRNNVAEFCGSFPDYYLLFLPFIFNGDHFHLNS